MLNISRGSNFHYGWWIVFGGFLTQIILLIAVQSLPICLSMIEKSLDITHAAAGIIVSLFGLCYAGFSFIWGYLADRFGPRLTLTYSGFICALGLVCFGLKANSLPMAIIFYSLVGFGAAGIFSATLPKLIGEWFTSEKRGKIMSFVASGGVFSSVSLGILIPVISTKFGWQTAFVILGGVTLIVTFGIYSIIRNYPKDVGLNPYGSPKDIPVQTTVDEKKNEKTSIEGQFLRVLKLRITWHLSSMFIFFEFAYMIGTAFLAVSIISAGYSVAEGGLAVSIYNLASLAGMWIWGPLSDKLERKTVLFMATACWVIFSFLYIYIWGHSLYLMYFVLFLMGMALGVTPVILAIFSDYYEPAYRGTGNGVISSLSLIGRFFGPLAAGIIADYSGSIISAFMLASVMMGACSITALSLPKLKRNLEKTI